MSLITPDFGLIFWMTLIFAIVFFILAKFGFPIITGMVEERNERISRSISEARKAEETLKDLSLKQEAILEECRREQAQIIKEAMSTRDELVSKAHEQAAEEAAGILSQAKKEIAQEKENAMREIRAEVARLSVEVAEKVLRENLSDDKKQLSLVEKILSETDSAKLS